MVSLVVKVLWKLISLICFRVYLEVNVHKNPTCFSRWSVRGYKKAGFLGALVATLGIVVPSFIVIFLISMFLDNFLEITIVANAFKGIKVGVGLLILDAAITMINKMQKKKLSRLIMICSCVTMLCINAFAWNFSSISLMIIAAIISLLVFVLRGTQEQKGGAKK